MDSNPSPDIKNNENESPAPELLKTRSLEASSEPAATETPQTEAGKEIGKKLHKRAYKPSHKGTFIGLAVVIAILVINVVVVGFILKSKSSSKNSDANSQVTISPNVLNQLGVSSNPVGDSGVKLTVGPDAEFKGKLTVAGDTIIGGQLKLNGKITGTEASFTQLEAGKTSLSQLDVNGATILHNDLAIAGKTQLQGAVTISQLLTVNNSVNISGNLAVGGILSANSFSAHSLTSNSTLTINGHVLTGGLTPSISKGTGLGTNGTVGISGNDSAGTISFNVGVGATSGTIASLAFKTQYDRTPRVVITAVGAADTFYLTFSNSSGFGVGVGSTLPPGGYSINYIVEQ
jgi:cytoskeletal protein CcmA (bactofilin family)